MVRKFILVGTWTNVQNILLSLKGIEKKNVMATAGKMNQLLEAVQSKSLLNKNWPSFTLTLIVPFTIISNFIVQFELLLIDTELTERKDGEL
jgi:hypothetical protein